MLECISGEAHSPSCFVIWCRRFVTIDVSRRAIPILMTDPMLAKCPIVGVWLKPGAKCVAASHAWFSSLSPDRQASSGLSPLLQWCFGQADVWAQCVRFLHGSQGQTVTIAPQTMLFAVFPPVHAASTEATGVVAPQQAPQFFECSSCPPSEDEHKQIHPLVRSFREDLTAASPWPATLETYASLTVNAVVDVGKLSSSGELEVVSSKGGLVDVLGGKLLRMRYGPPSIALVDFSLMGVPLGCFRFSGPDVFERPDYVPSETAAPQGEDAIPGTPPRYHPSAAVHIARLYEEVAKTEQTSAQASLIALQQQQIIELQQQVSQLTGLVKRLFSVVESFPHGVSYENAVLDLQRRTLRSTESDSHVVSEPRKTDSKKWIPDSMYQRWKQRSKDMNVSTTSTVDTSVSDASVDSERDEEPAVARCVPTSRPEGLLDATVPQTGEMCYRV
jgi:hypothetical protein